MSDIQCAARFLIARSAEAAGAAGTGPGLSRRGERQARELATGLRSERVAGVFGSTMSHARRTAQIVADGLHATPEDLPGVEGFAAESRQAGVASSAAVADQTVAAWWRGDLELRLPGGSSGVEVAGRFAAAIEDCADSYRGETVLVISHGGVMSVALAQLARRPELLTSRWIPHCGIARVDVDADGWAVLEWPGSADPSAAQG